MKNNIRTVYLLTLLVLYLIACKKKDTQPEIFIAPKEIIATSSAAGKGVLIRMDYAGNIITQKNDVAPFNFQRWYVGGNIRYTYLEEDTALGIQAVGYIPGSAIVLDSSLKQIRRFRLLPHPDHNPLIDALDGHEFILINDDHYIAEAYYEKVVTNIPDSLHPVAGCKVVTPIIQEVENGKIIWEWDGSIYPEFYGTSVEGNKFTDNTVAHDYIHLNSMYIDPTDNNLICSFRNLDQIVKLNRKTGDVIWRLGGKNSDFPLTPAQKFVRQHHATLADNNQTVLLYDNGDYVIRPSSRVLEFKLDQSNKKINSFKGLNLPFFGAFRGSIQKTDSSYFIGSGEVKYYEINYTTGKIILDRDLPAISYRVLRY